MDYLDASDVPYLMFRGLKRLEEEWGEDFI